MDLKSKIRTIPDFPRKGVMFRDITTLIKDAEAFNLVIDLLEKRYGPLGIDLVAGIESRGFIFGGALASRLHVGFVPIRKEGKLPSATERESYVLEYGTAAIEVHVDAIQRGASVLLVDDLVATGGTLVAAVSLIRRLGGKVAECAVVIELPGLHGREKLEKLGCGVFSLAVFEGD